MKNLNHVTICLFAVLAVGVLSPAPAAVSIQLEPVLTSGLASPLYLTSARDGTGRLFIVERGGMIKVLQPGSTLPTVFLDLTSKVLAGGERGLLGLAFHPNYTSNARFFVNYTRAADGATVVAEYSVSGNPNVANSTETVLLTIAQPFSNHNGGMIEFGPDNYFYIGMGDGGSGNDPGNRAQNSNDLLGKMLRIDVDSPSFPYTSPPDNPFFGSAPGRDEIFAIGLRNPWRYSFDRLTGELYVADVGQNAREEVSIVELGDNCGWRVFEGSQCTGLDPTLCNSPAQYVFPITEYDHSGERCSITGGYVYRGTQGSLPVGSYVYGEFCTGEIFLLQGGSFSVLLDTAMNISSFGEDEAGEIYVVDLNGAVYRIAGEGCSYSMAPTLQNFASSGGTGSVSVTATAGCAWTAVSNDTWITITAGNNGSGNGTVNYSVAPNTGSNQRTGTMTIAGDTFTVIQAGSPACSYAISPKQRSFSASSGTGTITVTAGTGCSWTASENISWITIISGGSGNGNGTLTYSVAANTTGNARTGTIVIQDKVHTVKQRK